MLRNLSFAAILLIVLWIFAVMGAAGRIFLDEQGWNFLVGLSSFAFIVGLIWTLSRIKPSFSELPDVNIFAPKRTRFWSRTLLLVLGLFMTIILGLVIGAGFSLMLVCGLAGSGLAFAWRPMITWKLAGIALAAGLICAVGIVVFGNGDLSWAIAILLTIPPTFIGGALLLRRTQLGHIRILEGRFVLGVQGFLVGCVLALPAALLNWMGSMQSQDSWISRGWQPLYAIVPAIAEETWARLFLVSFCYAMLRPVSNLHPQRAIIIAILISVIAWGFGHTGIAPVGIIVGSLLYGVPVALLLIKKDFEHAVGYHFLVDFIRYSAAFLS
jgi:hypothetical protein